MLLVDAIKDLFSGYYAVAVADIQAAARLTHIERMEKVGWDVTVEVVTMRWLRRVMKSSNKPQYLVYLNCRYTSSGQVYAVGFSRPITLEQAAEKDFYGVGEGDRLTGKAAVCSHPKYPDKLDLLMYLNDGGWDMEFIGGWKEDPTHPFYRDIVEAQLQRDIIIAGKNYTIKQG